MAVAVVTLIDYVAGGGAERAAVDIAMRLGPDARSTLVSSRLDESARTHPKYAATIAELEDRGVRWIGLGRTATARFWEWRGLVTLLRRERVSVLHSHLWGSNFWAPALAALGGVRAVVAHEQTPFARVGGMRQWGTQAVVNRWVAGRWADAIVVPSAWSRAALIAHEGVPAHKIHVIPNAADPVALTPGELATTRAELDPSGQAELVVVAAMLRPEKAQDVLIRAVAELAPSRPHLQLLLLGGGTPQRPRGTQDELEALASALGIADRVRFLGRREDVARVVAAADVAVLCSRGENLPLAVLEYMEAGTPIVATDVGGVCELVTDGVHALVVAPDDPGALARAIDDTLRDRPAARERAARARARRRERFDWDAIGAQVRGLYDELLADQSARGPAPL
ncbi:MAG: glycosyltransferase family 4 protein [Baekduia sp.]